MAQQHFILESPQRAAISRVETTGNHFLVLPLEPALAYSGGKPLLQLMLVEKDNICLQAFLSATVTLPMDEALLQAARQEIVRRYPDIQDPQSIHFARWDITSCTVTLLFDQEASLEMTGTFQGIGEPRVLMQKSLTAVEAAKMTQLWERGLTNASIHYSITLPTDQQTTTATVENMFKTHFAQGLNMHTLASKTTTLLQHAPARMTVETQAPLGLTAKELAQTIVKTNLSTR